MTIHNLYIFDRHCQCIYFQKWSHKAQGSSGGMNTTSMSQSGSNAANPNTTGSGSRLGGLTTSSSRFSASSPASSSAGGGAPTSSTNTPTSSSVTRGDDRLLQTQPTTSGLAAGSMISIEEEAKLVYGVIFSLRNFVRKLGAGQEGFISYRTSTYRLHYYETPSGLKFVMNSDPNTDSLRAVLKQIYVQLYVEFVVKNGLMRFDDTRWEISQGLLPSDQPHQDGSNAAFTASAASTNAPPPPGNISNELFRIAVDRFIRSLPVFE